MVNKLIFFLPLLFLLGCGKCDTSCVIDYVNCYSEIESCKDNCWTEHKAYVESNLQSCREIDGIEKCEDRSDTNIRRVLALDSKQCAEKCELNTNCEQKERACIKEVKQCALE